MVKDNISIEDASIHFRNFGGKPGKYNAEGNRNFCVFLDQELANRLAQDGWNVRWLTPRDENDPPQGYLQVAIAFGNFPPKVLLKSSKGKTLLKK